MHKLSADTAAPWKAGGGCQDLSLLKHPGFPAPSLIVAGVWGALGLHCGGSGLCLSLPSKGSACFPPRVCLCDPAELRTEALLGVLDFLQTAGICGVEEQGGREAPPGRGTQGFHPVPVALSVPGCAKAAATIPRAVNQ